MRQRKHQLNPTFFYKFRKYIYRNSNNFKRWKTYKTTMKTKRKKYDGGKYRKDKKTK